MFPRIAWTCAGAAIALELLVTFGLTAATPGHSLLNDYISTAGATDAPYQGAFMAAGIVAAVLHLVFVALLWHRGDHRWHWAAVGLFAGFFVFLGIGLAFQCDPGCALETAEAWTHFWFGLSAFLCLGLAAVVTAVLAWMDRGEPGAMRLFYAALVLIVADIALLASDLTKVVQGLTERATIVAMMVWSVLWAIRLELEAPESPATPNP